MYNNLTACLALIGYLWLRAFLTQTIKVLWYLTKCFSPSNILLMKTGTYQVTLLVGQWWVWHNWWVPINSSVFWPLNTCFYVGFGLICSAHLKQYYSTVKNHGFPKKFGIMIAQSPKYHPFRLVFFFTWMPSLFITISHSAGKTEWRSQFGIHQQDLGGGAGRSGSDPVSPARILGIPLAHNGRSNGCCHCPETFSRKPLQLGAALWACTW